jgi:hypothetical protein
MVVVSLGAWEYPMPNSSVYVCQCPTCQQPEDHPDKQIHVQMNLLLSRLDEQQRRWYVAVEANRIGHGGVRLLAQISGLDENTIRRGQQELDDGLAARPADRVRVSGGGRPPVEKKPQP